MQNAGIQEIEAILDEPHGESISSMLNNFWSQAQKLNTNPSGDEERLSFIQSASVLIQKANHIGNSLTTYQDNLNNEVIKSVDRINEIIDGIYEYNEKIAMSEISGDNANDYRDQRNLLIDELSGYMEIDYYEEADSRVVLKAEGKTVVEKQFVTHLELNQTVAKSPFFKPIWANTKEDVFKLDKTITSAKENDTGKLKSLLLTRGNDYVNAGTTWSDVALNDNFSVDVAGNSFLVPKVSKKFNDFINELIEMCNSSFDGEGIGIHEGKLGVPLYVPIKVPTGITVPTEPVLSDFANEADYITAYNTYRTNYKDYLDSIKSYLIPGNIKINPELLENGGYNKLGTVEPNSENIGDNTKVTEFLEKWNTNRSWPDDSVTDSSAPYYKKVDMMGYYSEFVTDIGIEGSGYKSKIQEKTTTILNIDNERQAMGGVSQDEEFTTMLKYQYAYNASARMITMLDSMMDTIINKL
jgi:flagellar hook-associated protein 1 FlgK